MSNLTFYSLRFLSSCRLVSRIPGIVHLKELMSIPGLKERSSPGITVAILTDRTLLILTAVPFRKIVIPRMVICSSLIHAESSEKTDTFV
ncbi:hypothetical protein AB1D50_004246 [Enterobacter hormaechei]